MIIVMIYVSMQYLCLYASDGVAKQWAGQYVDIISIL